MTTEELKNRVREYADRSGEWEVASVMIRRGRLDSPPELLVIERAVTGPAASPAPPPGEAPPAG